MVVNQFSKNINFLDNYLGSVLTELKFGLKLWNSDTTNNASARLVLSVLALPLTGPEIDKFGVGIEIFISNIESALRSPQENTLIYVKFDSCQSTARNPGLIWQLSSHY